MQKINPTFDLEIAAGSQVAGCDEAGRGPLCGPVVAAAVIFLTHDFSDMPIIRDSKQMSAAQRATAFKWLCEQRAAGKVDFGIAECSAAEIDKMNILNASLEAMRRAARELKYDLMLVDGNKVIPGLPCQAIVKGDSKSISIAAASILAKETRDATMRELDEKFPMYGWARNAGYPTAEHLNAIKKYGITPHHRKSYAPVRNSTTPPCGHPSTLEGNL
ncbi:MAG: ribonuclease HII [Rickettsiales bacterium]|jgi:ribonuclease HII|nr:ribonuclease HII [Rickettsiales bacterium]